MIEEAAHDGIGARDLAVVRRGVTRSERLRRVIGHVGLVEVEEEEERRPAVGVDPLLGQRHRHLPAPLVLRERAARRGVDPVFVEIEEGRQPRIRAQHVRGDGGPGHVALPLEQPGQAGAQRPAVGEARVRAHAVLRRQEAGEHGDVRGQGQGGRGPGVAEENGVRAQTVQRRRGHARVPVGGQVIGAQRVHGDEHDRRPHGHARRVGGRAAGGRDEREGEQPAVPGQGPIIPRPSSLTIGSQPFRRRPTHWR